MHYEQWYEGKHVLVTGGCGFIGSHLVERLVACGARVTILDNLSTGKIENNAKVLRRVRFIEGDIQDFKQCAIAVQGQEVIFHLAACVSVPESLQNPLHCYRVNNDGTMHLLEAARRAGGVRSFVFSSSAAVYGAHNGACHEELMAKPTSPYGLSKYMGEQLCAQYRSLYRIKTVSLRYFNVCGSRQDGSLSSAPAVARFRYCMMNNLPLFVHGDGGQTRDFISVDRVVEANMQFGIHALGDDAPLVCNVGTGTPTSLTEIIESLRQEYPHYGAPIEHMPDRPGDIRHSYASCERFTQWCV